MLGGRFALAARLASISFTFEDLALEGDEAAAMALAKSLSRDVGTKSGPLALDALVRRESP
jgi:hypothetical protein